MKRPVLLSLLLALPLLLGGCSSVSYYAQAVGGHLSLLADKRPVEDVIADPDIDAELAERLRLSQRILDFAHAEMALPDNGSYRHYVDLGRPFVTWNVVAAKTYSVEARRWCYPVAGCLGYRGYFDERDAERFAEKLRQEGWDVALGGALAYSTLGWMDDPLLSTMLEQPESRMVAVIVHELAHQRFYIKGRTCINESFASAVAAEGVRRWYAAKGDPGAYDAYLRDRRLGRALHALLLRPRGGLAALYGGTDDAAALAAGKRELFESLQREYRQFAAANDDNRYDAWMAQGLNNAHLAQIAAYYRLEPLFAGMIAERGGDMARFYGDLERFRNDPDGLGDCRPGEAAGEPARDGDRSRTIARQGDGQKRAMRSGQPS